MRVLAIDTALKVVAACVWDDIGGSLIACEKLAADRGHDEHLPPLIERVLAQTPDGLAGIDRIAVTAGPGSFTGIRIGIAAARAIGLVRRIPVIGVPTLMAFAAPYLGKGDTAVAALIDARDGRVYAQVFSTIGKCIVEPRILPVAAAVRLMGSGAVILTGNAAPLAAIEAWSMGLSAEVCGETDAPDISFVARIGALAQPSDSPPMPIYMASPNYQRAKRSQLTMQPPAS